MRPPLTPRAGAFVERRPSEGHISLRDLGARRPEQQNRNQDQFREKKNDQMQQLRDALKKSLQEKKGPPSERLSGGQTLKPGDTIQL